MIHSSSVRYQVLPSLSVLGFPPRKRMHRRALSLAHILDDPSTLATTPSSTSVAPKDPTMVRAKKRQTRSRCQAPDCLREARRQGKCFIHGGKRLCKMPNCNKCAHKGGLCFQHGGGQRCSVENCTKGAQMKGRCWRHGGKRSRRSDNVDAVANPSFSSTTTLHR